MSAEAYDLIWKHGANNGLRGNQLLAMLRIAESSKDRCPPFMGQVSFKTIAADLGLADERNAKRIISKLIKSGKLQLLIKGEGGLPNIYRFGHKGVAAGTVRGVAAEPPHLVNSTEAA